MELAVSACLVSSPIPPQYTSLLTEATVDTVTSVYHTSHHVLPYRIFYYYFFSLLTMVQDTVVYIRMQWSTHNERQHMATVWTITRDLLGDNDCNDTGVCGPSSCTLSTEEIKSHPDSTYFTMHGDDGELAYAGYMVNAKRPEDLDHFAPLDHFGMPNAGCTEIRYRNKKTGKMDTV